MSRSRAHTASSVSDTKASTGTVADLQRDDGARRSHRSANRFGAFAFSGRLRRCGPHRHVAGCARRARIRLLHRRRQPPSENTANVDGRWTTRATRPRDIEQGAATEIGVTRDRCEIVHDLGHWLRRPWARRGRQASCSIGSDGSRDHSFHEPKYIRTSVTLAFFSATNVFEARALEAIEIDRRRCVMPTVAHSARISSFDLKRVASAVGFIMRYHSSQTAPGNAALARAEILAVGRGGIADHSSTSRTSRMTTFELPTAASIVWRR